jgi:drug/metabolite transporter (DMT)-like permease
MLKSMKNQRKGYVFALMAVGCWSTIGSAFKISLRYADFLTLLLIASIVACAVLFVTFSVRRGTLSRKAFTPRNLSASAVMGLLNPFLYYVVLLQAYDRLPAQEAGTLNYIWPLVLVLLSIPILKQKIRILSIFAILVSFFGIIVISTHGRLATMEFHDPVGVLLAVGSAIFWALYFILNMKDGREDIEKIFLNFGFGAIYVLVYFLIRADFTLPSWEGIAGGIYLGLFEMGIPFVLWLKALNYSPTTAKVSNLIYLSPFISLILIHFVVGETILLSTVAGLVFIVAGIVWQGLLGRRTAAGSR